jgi:hypothetical protein
MSISDLMKDPMNSGKIKPIEITMTIPKSKKTIKAVER